MHQFCTKIQGGGCVDGGRPSSSLILDTSGNLYGTTFRGSAGDGSGVVFKLTNPNGGTKPKLEVLHIFCPGNGCAPEENGMQLRRRRHA